DVEQRRRLLLHGADHLRVAVSEGGHRDPPGEVEVLLAVRVPDPHALPPHQRHRDPLGEGHQVLVRPLHQLLGVHGVSFLSVGRGGRRPARDRGGARGALHRMISVPIPSVVSTSRRIAWGTRPSMMCAFWAPPARARSEDSTFGSMPPSITPALISRSASRWVRVETWRPSSPLIPCTSVRWMSFSPPRAAATSPATRSALMWHVSPPLPTPTGAITGMNPSAVSLRIASVLTASTSPTRPMSTSSPVGTRRARRRARTTPAPLPARPLARPPPPCLSARATV